VPKRYPAEFRRKVLDLVAAGRPVAQVAADLDISDQTIYVWRRQELIDTGQLPGTTSTENAELTAARTRIAELEAEVAIHRRAAQLLGKGGVPTRRYEAIAVMASEKMPAQLACRVLGIAESGYVSSPATTTGARAHPGPGRCAMPG
jgi:transposase-like protein